MLTEGDVVQIDPASEMGKVWGPQFVVVSEVKPWGLQGYFVHATERGKFGNAYVRLTEGSYVRIGSAEWVSP